MAITQQPTQTSRPGIGQTTTRIQLEQLDVKSLSKEKIRELFRLGKLPTAEQIVDEILFRAMQSGADDIHFEPFENELQVRFGHEGTLKRLVSLSPEMNEPIINILKTKAALNQFEKRKPQEGRFTTIYGNDSFDFRVNVLPVITGERCLIRIWHKATSIARIEEIGFSKENLDRFRALLRFPRGLLLVTGPAASGKSTTVYAAVNYIHTPEKSVITLEDPVEFRLPFASQVHLPPDKSFNFADGLRAILRQNPNIIVVGEIRDAETAIVAAEAAITGNLVISTMLANDAIGAIHRLFNLGVPPYLIASSLVGIVHQLLIRKICQNCREEYQLSTEELQMFNVQAGSGELRLYRGKGCQNCFGTGYRGRTAICEIVTVSHTLRDLINNKDSFMKMREEAAKYGYQAIRHDAMRKALSGTTGLNEITRVIG